MYGLQLVLVFGIEFYYVFLLLKFKILKKIFLNRFDILM